VPACHSAGLTGNAPGTWGERRGEDDSHWHSLYHPAADAVLNCSSKVAVNALL